MMKPRKVLLVSPYTYSISSRGMDVLTKSFEEENWQVDHLTFPFMFISPKIKPPSESKVNCLYARKTYLPYIDRIMFWIPGFLFRLIEKINLKTASAVDFSAYDYIVLESGKPLFLQKIIPAHVPVIYRLSDSVQLVLGKNRHYHQLEKDIFERAKRMVFKKAIYKNFLEDEQKEKVTVIENGMVIPKDLKKNSTFPNKSKNAIYVGLHQLDYKTVQEMVNLSPDCTFHIIGPCLGKNQVKKLRQFPNFRYYPFLSKEEYMPLLRDADLAVFPFRRTPSMKWFGLTSKFLHFMYFSLPIVSYPTGMEGEFDGLPVRFAQSKNEFASEVRSVLQSGEKIQYKIDFDFYSDEKRREEYKKFIRTL